MEDFFLLGPFLRKKTLPKPKKRGWLKPWHAMGKSHGSCFVAIFGSSNSSKIPECSNSAHQPFINHSTFIIWDSLTTRIFSHQNWINSKPNTPSSPPKTKKIPSWASQLCKSRLPEGLSPGKEAWKRPLWLTQMSHEKKGPSYFPL